MKQNLFVTQDGCPTFYSWMVCHYLGQDNPDGDFAFDMTYEKDKWPLDNKYSTIYNYLSEPGYYSHEGILRDFNRYWAQYRQFLRNFKHKWKEE